MNFFRGLLGGLRVKDAAVRPTPPAPTERAPPRIAPASVTVKAGVFVTEPSDELKALWSEATEAAGAKDYVRAVEAMDRVLEIQTEEDRSTSLSDEIRRCKYLQHAGRGAEAWERYSLLVERFEADRWSLVELFDAMRLHLQREGDPERGIRYGVAHRLCRIELYRAMKADALKRDPPALLEFANDELSERLRASDDRQRLSDVELADGWIDELTERAELRHLSQKLSRRARSTDRAEQLERHLLELVESGTGPFEYLKEVGEWRSEP